MLTGLTSTFIREDTWEDLRFRFYQAFPEESALPSDSVVTEYLKTVVRQYNM